MLVVHPVNGRLYNVVSDEHAQGPLWFSIPLVVIDTYEPAFYIKKMFPFSVSASFLYRSSAN